MTEETEQVVKFDQVILEYKKEIKEKSVMANRRKSGEKWKAGAGEGRIANKVKSTEAVIAKVSFERAIEREGRMYSTIWRVF